MKIYEILENSRKFLKFKRIHEVLENSGKIEETKNTILRVLVRCVCVGDVIVNAFFAPDVLLVL